MRIAVLEHFTALPERRRDPGLEAEGRAMRDAVVADLRRLPGVEVAIVERRRAFREMVRRADAALVIAPEQGGALERLCHAVEEEGRILLGPSAAAVRLAADKGRTARLLAAAGIKTPRTESIPFAAARARLRGWPPPFVLKPRDGCGARGISLVLRRSASAGRSSRAAVASSTWEGRCPGHTRAPARRRGRRKTPSAPWTARPPACAATWASI